VWKTAVTLPFEADKTEGSSIAPNPNNVNDAYLGVSGFTSVTGVGHVFRTTDFGVSWQRADGNPPLPALTALPDVPVIKMLVDRRDVSGNSVLAGTDIGVFSSTDGGGTWASYNLGGSMPNVPIFDLEQNYNGLIFAGTHGRGAYQLLPVVNPPFSPGAFQVTGDMSVSHDSATELPDGEVLVLSAVTQIPSFVMTPPNYTTPRITLSQRPSIISLKPPTLPTGGAMV